MFILSSFVAEVFSNSRVEVVGMLASSFELGASGFNGSLRLFGSARIVRDTDPEDE